MIATMLFVPGDRPERIATAIASGADCVVVDLEDAVALSAKQRAREGAVRGIWAGADGRCLLAVRVNAVASGMLEDDLAALDPVWTTLSFVVLPMVPDAGTVGRAARLLAAADQRAGGTAGPRLIPLIETAAGVTAAATIAAAHTRVALLTFGPADLSRELHVTPTAEGTELLAARSAVVLASAAAGLPSPIDGPWLTLDDSDGLRRSAEHARTLGFGGKQIIHPCQLACVAEVFTVSADDLSWARRVDEAFTEAERRGVASIRLPGGDFIDYAVALRARGMLERGRACQKQRKQSQTQQGR